MTFLLLNQTFHPDVQATGQYLSELAVGLVKRGHEVTVVTSRRAYDDPQTTFPARELWQGVKIVRVASTSLGKSAPWRRAADFASFLISCCFRLLFLPRPDVVVALTTPPLISFIGAGLAKLRRSQFFYWVMDFNPDEAIAAGWLRPDSVVAKILERMSRFSLRRATRIIALDRFMRDRIVAKGIPSDKIAVIPPWSQDDNIQFDAAGRDHFRRQHGLENKFVVMYSGNHSPVHPLQTLVAAASEFSPDENLAFAFIGGGSEWRKIKERSLKPPFPTSNLPSPDFALPAPSSAPPASPFLCLPYQPRAELSASLSAADLHVVVMGNAMLGLVHPCKIYNILKIGTPVLYIGPDPSHVSEMFQALNGSYDWGSVRQGDSAALVREVRRLQGRRQPGVPGNLPAVINTSKSFWLPRLIDLLETGC